MKRPDVKKTGLKKKKRSHRSSPLEQSEVRYRRLFEAAQDGILILDAETGLINDANPFMVKLLGVSRARLLSMKLWEIGLFQNVERSRSAFRELQRTGYIRYEDMPLETRDGRCIDVEFVSNVYKADGIHVIQCNIRDITERKYLEVEKAILETVEEEQRRIGQDLHDGLCQQLAGIALLAKALARKVSLHAPEESTDASEIADLISVAINQTRDLARGLSPVEIEVPGLPAALEQFASMTARQNKINCLFFHNESPRFKRRYSSVLATHLYRIVQEAVSNAIRHGRAKRVVITLAATHENGLLTIHDNGIGFKDEDEHKLGMGLRSMRYRCKMIGARFSIRRDTGGGTLVTCLLAHEKSDKLIT